MSFRRFATGAALAIAGLAAAVGIGLLANTISGDSVGLGAEPLSAGETLAPATAKSDDANQRQRRHRNRNRGGDDARTTTSPTLTDELAPATPPTVTDDHGGDRSDSDDGSGSGSSGSGSSGSSGSGSSGSGSSGSDDSGKIDD
jgi:hypothetical protein